jgi:hypothetical protein
MSQSILGKSDGKLLGRPARFWHKRRIDTGFSGELVFFDKSESSNKRVTNLETMGQTTGYSEFILRRLELIFAPGDERGRHRSSPGALPFAAENRRRRKGRRNLGLGRSARFRLPGSGVVTVGVPSPRDAYDLSAKAVKKNTPWNATLRGASEYGLKLAENVFVTLAAEVFLITPRAPR